MQVSDLAHLLEDGTKVKNILKSSHLYLIHITRKFISGRKTVEYHATSIIAKERRPEQAAIERQIFSAWVQPPWQRQILHQPVHPTWPNWAECELRTCDVVRAHACSHSHVCSVCGRRLLKLPKSSIKAKSWYISFVMSNLYGTEYEIWAGFGPVGSTVFMGIFP